MGRKLRNQTDHMTHLAVAGAGMALADAGVDLESVGEFERGVVAANSSGGVAFGQRELQKLWSHGPAHVSAYMSVAWFYAATAGQLSIRHGLRGPCMVTASEQAGGLDAVGHARRQVRRGTRLVLTGGTDASVSPVGLSFEIATGLLSTEPAPDRAFVPFDARARGYVPGDGGAILVMEDEAAARERGAPRIYGRLAGYAATFDPPDPRAPARRAPFDPPSAPAAPRLRRAAEKALADAGLAPDDIGAVFADAYGVPELDLAESRAVEAVFGPGGVPVTAPKTLTGRLSAGGSALDLATALLALRDGVIPPTANVDRLAPGVTVDLVREPRPAPLRAVLVLARGYGGFNAAAVVTR
ncbi:beta-ketoacyl synthase N-terminal-like domain-containing protein [Streptomonospora nanhaiensis]|nr:beta-ketoacyl synthase N-terminal-like domain-containing protein [Streptomonospora nanhaiensis]